MLIAFVHDHKAFLPALQGYLEFFRENNIKTTVCSKRELYELKPDVEWHFMGMDTKPRSGAAKIHDYSSASTPPFASLKNRIKSRLNTKPDYRLFPNQYVFDRFGFEDNVPYGFRDVGIKAFTTTTEVLTKEFDFIYVGELQGRRLEPLFDRFIRGELSNKTLLLLTRNYEHVSRKMKEYSNIQFKGPVPAGEVKNYIQLSRFGINYIPDIEPFNRQASTKFLEYAANRIPIISTRYSWIEGFQRSHGGKYFYLNDNLSNFTWDGINGFDYEFPDLSNWTWEQQIKKSGVLEFLSSRFGEKFAAIYTNSDL